MWWTFSFLVVFAILFGASIVEQKWHTSLWLKLILNRIKCIYLTRAMTGGEWQKVRGKNWKALIRNSCLCRPQINITERVLGNASLSFIYRPLWTTKKHLASLRHFFPFSETKQTTTEIFSCSGNGGFASVWWKWMILVQQWQRERIHDASILCSFSTTIARLQNGTRKSRCQTRIIHFLVDSLWLQPNTKATAQLLIHNHRDFMPQIRHLF